MGTRNGLHTHDSFFQNHRKKMTEKQLIAAELLAVTVWPLSGGYFLLKNIKHVKRLKTLIKGGLITVTRREVNK